MTVVIDMTVSGKPFGSGSMFTHKDGVHGRRVIVLDLIESDCEKVAYHYGQLDVYA